MSISLGLPNTLIHPVTVIGNGTGAGNNSWIGFYEQDGKTRRGYVGDPTSNTLDIVLASEGGAVRLTTSGGTGVTVNTDGSASITTLTVTTLTVNSLQLGGSTLTEIQRGTINTAYSAATRLTATVTFPNSFSSTPTVSATGYWVSGDVSLDNVCLIYVQDITTTGFTVRFTNKYNTSFVSGNTLHVNWIAMN